MHMSCICIYYVIFFELSVYGVGSYVSDVGRMYMYTSYYVEILLNEVCMGLGVMYHTYDVQLAV